MVQGDIGLIRARTAASADWGPVGEVEGTSKTTPELQGKVDSSFLGCQHGVAGVRQRREHQQRWLMRQSLALDGKLCSACEHLWWPGY